MRTAIYVRVSTSEQEINGHSLKEQEERAKKFCEAMGWSVYKVYRDGGFSGANTDRPALQQMIKDVQNHRINKILVYKLDRLSRSQLDTLYLVEKVFLANGVDFVSMSENFDTSTPFGKAMIGILAVFAQLEKDQIRERMMMGMSARAKDGKFHGSATVPIGYDYINGELVVNEFEAVQIQKAHELYLSGMGIGAICDYLNQAGMTHKHGKWINYTMRIVLGKKTYIGYTWWQGKWYRGTHTPIISEDTWEKVNRLKNQKHEDYLKHNRRHGMASSYLGGFLYCGHCGAKYVKCSHYSTKNGEKYAIPLYKCNSRAKKNKDVINDPNCRNKIWNMDELNDLILGEIRKLKLEPVKPKQKQDDTKPIRAEIEKLDDQISKLMDLYSVNSVPLDVLQQKILDLSDRKNRLEQSIVEPKPALNRKEMMKRINSLSDILEEGDLAQIRNLIGILIDRIVLDGEDIIIHWNFD